MAVNLNANQIAELNNFLQKAQYADAYRYLGDVTSQIIPATGDFAQSQDLLALSAWFDTAAHINADIGHGSGLQRGSETRINSRCRSFLPEKKFDCVFVLIQIKERDASGHPIYSAPFDMIHIKLPKGWEYFDTGDTGCKIAEYPDADIVAIGQWVDRKKPLLGGYAHSLKKAWRVDYQSMRFVEIPTHGVECGYNDDRD